MEKEEEEEEEKDEEEGGVRARAKVASQGGKPRWQAKVVIKPRW